LPEWLAALDAETGAEHDGKETPPSPGQTAGETAPTAQPAKQPTARKKKKSRLNTEQQLKAARSALEKGDLATALKFYAKLIRRKRYLDEIVADLEQALLRYPVHVEMWQTLGDAYARQDRLSDALEAYNKAEALLR